jgi:hypothetical protein
MIDPFLPVQVTEEALKIEVKGYYKSWLEEGGTPSTNGKSTKKAIS